MDDRRYLGLLVEISSECKYSIDESPWQARVQTLKKYSILNRESMETC